MTEKNPDPEIEPRADRPHMPGYGILDANSGKGLFPWSWAVERLEKTRSYWIATTRPDGAPHAMPVWGLWIDGALYFSTGKESRKARNLAANPRCVIGCGSGGDEAVVMEGVVEEIQQPSASLLRQFFDAYKAKYQWDMDSMDQDAGPIFKVCPKVVFGLSTGLAESATRWRFDE